MLTQECGGNLGQLTTSLHRLVFSVSTWLVSTKTHVVAQISQDIPITLQENPFYDVNCIVNKYWLPLIGLIKEPLPFVISYTFGYLCYTCICLYIDIIILWISLPCLQIINVMKCM